MGARCSLPPIENALNQLNASASGANDNETVNIYSNAYAQLQNSQPQMNRNGGKIPTNNSLLNPTTITPTKPATKHQRDNMVAEIFA